MTFGSLNPTESPLRAKHLRRKSSPRKNNRVKNERTFKTKGFHDATSIESSPPRDASSSVPIPRRKHRDSVGSSSPETHYAGPKFSSPPPPSVLPKPPSHWLSYSDFKIEPDVAAMTQHLRSLLHVAS